VAVAITMLCGIEVRIVLAAAGICRFFETNRNPADWLEDFARHELEEAECNR
jgi:hypothetical protein